MIDGSVPLFNVFIGNVKFFADQTQIAGIVEWLETHPGEPFQAPSWIWAFDAGFDESID